MASVSKPQLRLIAELLRLCRDRDELETVLDDLLTASEIQDIAERWAIVQLLFEGKPQRDVAKEAGVSISKVTRAAHVLREGGRGFRLLNDRRRKR